MLAVTLETAPSACEEAKDDLSDIQSVLQCLANWKLKSLSILVVCFTSGLCCFLYTELGSSNV